jgi:hypothetical protein
MLAAWAVRRYDHRTSNTGFAAMNKLTVGLVALGGVMLIAPELQAHHAVAGVYDLNKEIVVEGTLTKLNFVNPHANLQIMVTNPDGTKTEWVLTTASIQTLTRQGINKTSIKAGESLKATVLPARNGNPAGFIRRLELGDQKYNLVIE